jgi:acyl-CoA reductase-like NAD-dependent aldehyde dehydrogenase
MAQMTIADIATHGFLVDGKWIEDGDIVEVKAPYDGNVVGRVFQGTRAHAEAAIAAAVKAFGTTRRLPAFERQRVLRRVAEGIAKRNSPAFCARKRASPSRRRARKSTALCSLLPSLRKRARASMANIFRWTGRNTRRGDGDS